jgi:outer membrane murein-binding lipoprotein Lpp
MRYAPALAAAVLLAGCGGHESPSRAQFIARADRICTQVNTQFPAIQRTLSSTLGTSSPDLHAAADALDRAHRLGVRGLTRLRALAVPHGDEALVSSLWKAVGDQVAAIGRLADGVRRNDPKIATPAQTDILTAAQRYRDIAAGYGFHECGSHIGSG